jgi:anthranilate synthase component 1
MFDFLTYSQFKTLATANNHVVVYKEILSDTLTPTQMYAAIKNTARDIMLLESNPNEGHLGRYSHLCFDPIVTVSATLKETTVYENGQSRQESRDPFDTLRDYRAKMGCRSLNPLCKFAGGFVGYLAYDGVRFIEDIPKRLNDEEAIPVLLFRYCQNHISFDHKTGNIVVATVSQIHNCEKELVYEEALARIDSIIDRLKSPPSTLFFNKNREQLEIRSSVSDDEFSKLVLLAKQHILDGDIFQVVLSREFSAVVGADGFDIYRALRFSNPSPYMFYFEVGKIAFAGASPEKLVSIDQGVVETRPLAGTRSRGRLPDDLLAKDLLKDSKEVAEHMMLVDLARNDVGRVAKPGSVKVTRLKEIEYYARVIHISSTVQAELRNGKDVFDAIKAAFPAGTLSGAPKIRAMEIIDALEQSPRGLYGGMVGGIDSEGNLDSCIAIRMATIKEGVATVRAGAGIVYDSDPQQEADETRHKAQAILEGIRLAGGLSQ